MKFDFPRKIRSGYFIAFLLLLFSYFLSITALVQLREQNEWVHHTQEVISKLGLLVSYLKDSEIGWRGYMLMKDEKFLEPYFRSQQQVDSVCQVLANAVKDNSGEKEKVEWMRQMINRKYQINGEQMESFRRKSFQTNEVFKGKTLSSKMIMDSIGFISGSMGNRETELLNIRLSKVNYYNKIVFGIMIIAGTVSVLLILYSLITFNMESRAKKNATLQAESYHDQLEKRILELDSANRELIELRSLERFTSTGQIARVIAHEVRNPLTNIDLSASHLGNSNLSGEDKKIFLDIIGRNSKRINQLITELLTATKFSDLNYEQVTANELVDESLTEAIDRALLSHVRIEKKYSSAIIWLNVDRPRMKIALLNIIVNAIESMPEVDGMLKVETAIVNDCCRIAIRDNGRGMNAETLSKIFDPYFTSKSNGNGLGLTNTQNIILNHKGKIQAFSAMEKGTEFIITLNIVKTGNGISV